MQTTLLLLAKIGLLLLLWLFIWLSIRALRKDTNSAAGLSRDLQPIHGGPGMPAPARPEPRKELGNKPPHSLVLTTGPLTGTTLKLKGYTEITIGRAPTCTLILEDDFASGTHARLIRHGNAWYLEDVDSRNGTWIGTQRIDQPERLYAGSEFRVGQTSVRMEQ
ncbi:FHA domain-containing protein [Corynebacterium sp. 320]|uniref:FHA domain-containing protein FhaB/FipA n=1 Tax=Corynebacterium TaxID=1716 RepID=UPI00125CBAC9|nr:MULTISPECIES: FHA domain-containing protein [Corynebacterium]KAB1502833.1 FHA domain-containing protein [Corynebacterium sp. 320]KAB1550426.1 FHA domain-containing protein [Corynebacterium sp. 319]KAB1554843.1 FHA domain-containing protein [Corynebacterium sp. 321]KAB3526496.1 FHA domain-containing protein [Corynebacterium sp. 250]KAB3539815.1 FHA domain-containing protein [Corynebacterium sp. 366]